MELTPEEKGKLTAAYDAWLNSAGKEAFEKIPKEKEGERAATLVPEFLKWLNTDAAKTAHKEAFDLVNTKRAAADPVLSAHAKDASPGGWFSRNMGKVIGGGVGLLALIFGGKLFGGGEGEAPSILGSIMNLLLPLAAVVGGDIFDGKNSILRGIFAKDTPKPATTAKDTPAPDTTVGTPVVALGKEPVKDGANYKLTVQQPDPKKAEVFVSLGKVTYNGAEFDAIMQGQRLTDDKKTAKVDGNVIHFSDVLLIQGGKAVGQVSVEEIERDHRKEKVWDYGTESPGSKYDPKTQTITESASGYFEGDMKKIPLALERLGIVAAINGAANTSQAASALVSAMHPVLIRAGVTDPNQRAMLASAVAEFYTKAENRKGNVDQVRGRMIEKLQAAEPTMTPGEATAITEVVLEHHNRIANHLAVRAGGKKGSLDISPLHLIPGADYNTDLKSDIKMPRVPLPPVPPAGTRPSADIEL